MSAFHPFRTLGRRFPNGAVNLHNLSLYGCKLEFVERPLLDELVWVKFGDLEGLEASVCWVDLQRRHLVLLVQRSESFMGENPSRLCQRFEPPLIFLVSAGE
jgi:hypothetical protein